MILLFNPVKLFMRLPERVTSSWAFWRVLKMQERKRFYQKGASLTEVLIVLTIGSILFVVAASQFGQSDKNLTRQNIAREFKVSLERARFDSVKRRPSNSAEQSRVTILSATSFSYTVDRNQNGRLDTPGETLTVDFGNRSNVRITGTNFVFPITISFDARGEITVTNGTTPPVISPIFYFCNGSCTVATADNQNANKIYVSPTGTVIMMGGGDVLPTFAAPSVTTVTSTTAVNPLLAVWTDPAASPTASPSGTPTPSPTQSPNSSPSATATATATSTSTSTPTPVSTGTPVSSPVATATPVSSPTVAPTANPSPSPVACAYGERPPPCVCQAPRWIRQNGKCQ